MYLLDQRVLGIVILFLLGMLVIIKQLATGSIFEKPKGSPRIWLVNVFNLFFLLVVNPLAAILLVTRQWEAADPTHLVIDIPWVLVGLEVAGLALVVTGYLLMASALLRLRGNYQLGGSPPRAADEIVVVGPYRLIRHPMYTAALSISRAGAASRYPWTASIPNSRILCNSARCSIPSATVPIPFLRLKAAIASTIPCFNGLTWMSRIKDISILT